MKAASSATIAMRSTASQGQPVDPLARDRSMPVDGAGAPESTGVDRDLVSRSQDVDQWLSMLRSAIDDSGWKHDALAAHLAIDKAHLSRLLSGEKPFRLEHLVGLPDDIEALFERRRAEHFGLIVVTPAVGADAVQQLVSGLIGLLAPRPSLPARADSMVKASLPLSAAKVGTR